GIRFCDGPVPVSEKITIGSWSLELLACWLLYNFYHNAIFVLMLFWYVPFFVVKSELFEFPRCITQKKGAINKKNKYEIEVDSLEEKYEVWQRKLHPDLVFKIHQVQNPST
ncbi:hypothetical protein ES319_D08G119200v1, partial [Gossypium barbadense]